MTQTPNTPKRNQKLLKSKGDFSREELAAFFESLAERVRAGDMTLGTGDNALAMDLPGTFRTTMEVTDSRKRRGIERELEIEIDWYVDENGKPVTEDGPASGFAIS